MRSFTSYLHLFLQHNPTLSSPWNYKQIFFFTVSNYNINQNTSISSNFKQSNKLHLRWKWTEWINKIKMQFTHVSYNLNPSCVLTKKKYSKQISMTLCVHMLQPVENDSWRVLAGMLAALKVMPLSLSPSSAHHHLRLPSFDRRVNNIKERYQIDIVYLTSKICLKPSSWHILTKCIPM